MIRVARTIAEVDGVCDVELLAEAEQMLTVCLKRGITSTEGMARYWAAELGMTPEELEQELARYREPMA